jgi:hypothetical protein
MLLLVALIVYGTKRIEVEYKPKVSSTALFSELASELQVFGFKNLQLMLGGPRSVVIGHRADETTIQSTSVSAAQWAGKRVDELCSSGDTLMLDF